MYLFGRIPKAFLKTPGWWWRAPDTDGFVHPISGNPFAPEMKGGSLPEAVLRKAKEAGAGHIGIQPKRLGAVAILILAFESPALNEAQQQVRSEILSALKGNHYMEIHGRNLVVWAGWQTRDLGPVPEEHPLFFHQQPVVFVANPVRTGFGKRKSVPAPNRPLKHETLALLLRGMKIISKVDPPELQPREEASE